MGAGRQQGYAKQPTSPIILYNVTGIRLSWGWRGARTCCHAAFLLLRKLDDVAHRHVGWGRLHHHQPSTASHSTAQRGSGQRAAGQPGSRAAGQQASSMHAHGRDTHAAPRRTAREYSRQQAICKAHGVRIVQLGRRQARAGLSHACRQMRLARSTSVSIFAPFRAHIT